VKQFMVDPHLVIRIVLEAPLIPVQAFAFHAGPFLIAATGLQTDHCAWNNTEDTIGPILDEVKRLFPV
jgi:hypothetical protein